MPITGKGGGAEPSNEEHSRPALNIVNISRGSESKERKGRKGRKGKGTYGDRRTYLVRR